MNHNWEYKAFNEAIMTLTPKRKIGKSDYLEQGAYPIISQEEEFISGYWNNQEDVTPVFGESVVFGDHSRVLKYIDFDFVVGADGVKILLPQNGLQAKFLYYFLKWKDVPSLGYSRHFKLLKEFDYPVPPLSEQERIVWELDKINEAIADCQKLLRNLDTLAQSLFYETFGDPIANPKCWKTEPIQSISPSNESILEPQELNGKFWLLNLEQVESNSGRILELEYFSIENIGSSTVNFDEGNVLYSKLRPYLNKVVIPQGRGYCTSELIPLRPNPDYVTREYIAYALRLPEFVKFISAKTGGAKMPRVKMQHFWNYQMPVPPLELQQKFSERIGQIDAQKKAVEETIANLQTLLDSRMAFWFN